MANHLQPTITSTYANFVTEMDARFDDLAVGLDPAVTSATNVPTNSIRWNSVSNKWQKYNGSSWGDLSASYAINISGSSASAVNLSTTRSNWSSNGTITAVVGQLAWKNYSNGHTVFDASAGTSPDGTAISSVNPSNLWSNTYPTLMGWNGSATYGVRVDSSRVSDYTAASVTFTSNGAGAAAGTAFNGSTNQTISYNTVGAPSTTGANASGTWGINISGNAASVSNGVYTNGSYANPTWITSLAGSKISGDIAGNAATATALATARNINGVPFNGTAAISINLNNYITFNNTGAGVGSGFSFNGSGAMTISYNSIGAPSTTGANASGTWGINITGNAASVTNGVYNNGGTYGINISGNASTASSAGSATNATNATNATRLVTSNWIVEESAGVLQIKTSGGTLKFAMDATNGFTVY